MLETRTRLELMRFDNESFHRVAERLVQMKKESGTEMREMRGQVHDLTADVQELNRACRVARGGDQYQ